MLTIERAYDEKTKRRKRDIAVDDVRKINGFMALTPAEGGWRVAVIDGAEDLNQNSANALLKILEEPPARAVLILVCSAPGRLPPTIRSRCRPLRLSALSDPVMAELLALYLPERSQDDRDRLITLAEGSIGRALAMADDDGIAVATMVDKLLAALPNVPLSRGHEVADALGRSDTGFHLFTDQLIAGHRGPGARHCAEGAPTRNSNAWQLCCRLKRGVSCGRGYCDCRMKPNGSRWTSARRWSPASECSPEECHETRVLHHNPDLLREWRAAYRARLHLDRG